MKTKYQHDQKLDFLRGTAALLVCADHCESIFVAPLVAKSDWSNAFFSFLGMHSVFIFFLLSGFLVTISILANLDRNGAFSTLDYVVSRISRIFPPLLGAILICLGAFAMIQLLGLPGSTQNKFGVSGVVPMRDYFSLSAGDVWSALTMQNGLLQVDGPLWTLNIEVIDYIAALFVCLCLTSSGTLRIFSFVGLALTLWHGQAINSQFYFYTAIWALGSVFALNAYLGSTTNAIRAIVATVLVCALSFVFLDQQNDAIYMIACLGYASVIFWVPFPKFLSRLPLLTSAAEYSYTLYVTHFPVLLFAYSLTQESIGKSMPLAIGTAMVCYAAALILAKNLAAFLEDKMFFAKPIHELMTRMKAGLKAQMRA